MNIQMRFRNLATKKGDKQRMYPVRQIRSTCFRQEPQRPDGHRPRAPSLSKESRSSDSTRFRALDARRALRLR